MFVLKRILVIFSFILGCGNVFSGDQHEEQRQRQEFRQHKRCLYQGQCALNRDYQKQQKRLTKNTVQTKKQKKKDYYILKLKRHP